MNQLISLTGASIPHNVRVLHELRLEPPASWQGLALAWRPDTVGVPVFLRSFELAPDLGSSPGHLLGVRYELSRALVDEVPLGEGFFVEYLLASSTGDGNWSVQRLLQRNSVTYSPVEERDDYVAYEGVAFEAPASRRTLPRWESTADAIWPLVAGRPMLFVGQLTIPESPIAKEYFAWNLTVYLFALRTGDALLYKVVEQECGAQSAAEHYLAEEDSE